jgi:methionyl-tRNA formyltransferase
MAERKDNLRIVFMGGNQAGMIAALSALACGSSILAAVAYTGEVGKFLRLFGIPLYKSVKSHGFKEALIESDLLLCVHGREIVASELLSLPRLAAVNVHPYLYKYKGASPVLRALQEKEFRGSVGAHLMTEKVDGGKVLFEEFIDVGSADSVEEIYNRLYPAYGRVVSRIIQLYQKKKRKK